MRVFVTGATGFVGSAVVQELIDAGHQVIGLARSDEGAKSLAAAGAKVQRGDLQDLDSLRSGAAMSDGVIHTAFIHDFSNFKQSSAIDERAIQALADELAGSDRPLVVTSGVALLAPGRTATEDDKPPARSELIPSRLGSDSCRGGGPGRAGVDGAPRPIGPRRRRSRLRAAAHRDRSRKRRIGLCRRRAQPLARRAPARCGASLPAGARKGRARAPVITGSPTKACRRVRSPRSSADASTCRSSPSPPAEAAEHFGFLGYFFGADIPASSKLTSERLGWRPKQPGLIADLDHPRYFQA